MSELPLADRLREHASHQEHISPGFVRDILGPRFNDDVVSFITNLPVLVIDPTSPIAHQYPTAPITVANPKGGVVLGISSLESELFREAAMTAHVLELCNLLPHGEGFRLATQIAKKNGEADFGNKLTGGLANLVRLTFRQSDTTVESESGKPKQLRIATLRRRASGIFADIDAGNIASGIQLGDMSLRPHMRVEAGDLPDGVKTYKGIDVSNVTVETDRATEGKLHVCADCGLGIARGASRLTVGLQESDRSSRDHHHFHVTCAVKKF